MFLLFQFLRYHHGFCFQDLHSNMFLLFLCSHFSRSTFNHIYIPICFYYFTISPSERYNSDMHLHSNMFLLFRITNSIYATYNHNLHSNMFLLFQSILRFPCFRFHYLHSNMFLLFHTGQGNRDAFRAEFTFQYVSIISLAREAQKASKKPIYIPICFYYFGLRYDR